MVGKRFGKLTPLRPVCNRQRPHYECLCDCGNVLTVRKSFLLKGQVRSCGCMRKETLSKLFSKGCGDVTGTYFAALKTDSKKHGHEFSITIEYIAKLLEKQEFTCEISGLNIRFGDNYRDFLGKSACLERIDYTKGMIEGNVRWVHKDVNTMRKGFDKFESFLSCVKLICEPLAPTNDHIIYEVPTYRRKSTMPGSFNTSDWHAVKGRSIKMFGAIYIEPKDIWDTYLKQNGCCCLTGQPLFFSRNQNYKVVAGNASIDRIDSDIGYTKDNIQILEKSINIIKTTFSNSYIKDLCLNIHQHLKLEHNENLISPHCRFRQPTILRTPT